MHHPRNDPRHTPTHPAEESQRRSDAPLADQELLAAFRAEGDALEARWRDEADVDGVFNTQIGDLARRLLAAVPAAAPGVARLRETLDIFTADNMSDDDVAEELIYCVQDVTDQVAWPRSDS